MGVSSTRVVFLYVVGIATDSGISQNYAGDRECECF